MRDQARCDGDQPTTADEIEDLWREVGILSREARELRAEVETARNDLQASRQELDAYVSALTAILQPERDHDRPARPRFHVIQGGAAS